MEEMTRLFANQSQFKKMLVSKSQSPRNGRLYDDCPTATSGVL
jgi:hypothetical protein